jgi:hypothetical protein
LVFDGNIIEAGIDRYGSPKPWAGSGSKPITQVRGTQPVSDEFGDIGWTGLLGLASANGRSV